MIRYDENYFETDDEKKLFRLLKAIRDSYDFVIGIMVNFRRENADKIPQMIEYLEKSGDKNCGNILLKSCEIIGEPVFAE